MGGRWITWREPTQIQWEHANTERGDLYFIKISTPLSGRIKWWWWHCVQKVKVTFYCDMVMFSGHYSTPYFRIRREAFDRILLWWDNELVTLMYTSHLQVVQIELIFWGVGLNMWVTHPCFRCITALTVIEPQVAPSRLSLASMRMDVGANCIVVMHVNSVCLMTEEKRGNIKVLAVQTFPGYLLLWNNPTHNTYTASYMCNESNALKDCLPICCMLFSYAEHWLSS